MSAVTGETPAPRLSVVIASWCDEALLVRCLESIEAARGDRSIEVVVATNMSAESLERVRARFPRVRGTSLPDATVFQLRAAGAAMALGDVVAIIEDHVTVAPAWVRALLDAHDAGHGVLGGPVENGLVHRAYDWALYFVEYGLHIPPVPDGPVHGVSGANVAYDRALLDSCAHIWRETLHENEVNDALRRRGHGPYMVAAATVSTHLPMTLSESMVHLFQGGRIYGRYRAGSSPWYMRPVFIVLSPAVPCVLFARIARRVASRAPSRLLPLARGVGYFALILGAWSVGELAGYASAPRGARA